jgi:hypothetical protein
MPNINVFKQALEDLSVLQEWAPSVLSEDTPNPEELREIILRRARAEGLIESFALENDDATLFYYLAQADRACAPWAHALLNLSRGEAQTAAQQGFAAAGKVGELNPCAWWGVHEWGVVFSGRILGWRDQLSVVYGVEASEAEVLASLNKVSDDLGDEYVNDSFFSNEQWCEELSPEALGNLRTALEKLRARKSGIG